MHILFTSGYTADGAVRRELLQSGNPFLEKPYPVAALSDAVRQALVKEYRQRNDEDEARMVSSSTAAIRQKLAATPETS